MKKLHRISAFFLSVLMSIALLTSCGNNGAATPNASSSAISTTPSAIDTAPIPDLPDRKTICIMERGNEKCQTIFYKGIMPSERI